MSDLNKMPTKEGFQDMFDCALSKGWMPQRKKDLGCSCHISAPCSGCVYDDITTEDMVEFAEEKGLEITNYHLE